MEVSVNLILTSGVGMFLLTCLLSIIRKMIVELSKIITMKQVLSIMTGGALVRGKEYPPRL